MAWAYVPGLEASRWPSGSLSVPAIEPSLWWRGRPMPLRSWRTAWRRGTWIHALSGLTSPPSTAARGVAEWASSLPASPASRGARPATAEESRTSGGSGPTSSASFARWDPATSCWRTSQACLFGGLDTFSGPWPSSGSMRSGVCTARPRSALPTSGDGSSSLLPPPAASAYGYNQGGQSPDGPIRYSLEGMASRNLLPTPTVKGDYNRADYNGKSGDGLVTAVLRMLPTPRARDGKGADLSSREGGASLPASLEGNGKRLSPLFVEQMMLLPTGWTACEPLGTPSSPCRQQEPSSTSPGA